MRGSVVSSSAPPPAGGVGAVEDGQADQLAEVGAGETVGDGSDAGGIDGGAVGAEAVEQVAEGISGRWPAPSLDRTGVRKFSMISCLFSPLTVTPPAYCFPMAGDSFLEALGKAEAAVSCWCAELDPSKFTPAEAVATIDELIELERVVGALKNRLASRLDRIANEQRATT